MAISADPLWNRILNMMQDTTISELTINGPTSFYYKQAGVRKEIPDIPQMTDEEYTSGVERGLIPLVKSMTPYEPNAGLFEGKLKYRTGEVQVEGRCHIVHSPAAETPQITFARKTPSLTTLEKIASSGSMSTEMMNFLVASVQAGLNIVLSGSSGAGKTTMMEALTKYIPNETRIGVAEDLPELKLMQENVTYLHSSPRLPGEDRQKVTLEWVVQQFQRNRCDLLLVGEVRGKEFSGFLTAANSGLDGSMTTMHADDPGKCLTKMSNFAQAGSVGSPVRAINTDIANSVDIIVQLIRDGDKYRCSHIQEISSTIGSGEDAKISTAPLYLWNRAEDGFYKESVISDHLRNKFLSKGIDPTPFLKSPREVLQPGHVGRNTQQNTSTNAEQKPSRNPLSRTRKLPTAPMGRNRNI